MNGRAGASSEIQDKVGAASPGVKGSEKAGTLEQKFQVQLLSIPFENVIS